MKIFTKRKRLTALFVVAAVLAAGIVAYFAQREKPMSNVALANIEAIAQGESSGNIYCCGNYGVCMRVLCTDGTIRNVIGLKLYYPCPGS